jgi:regulator of nucleoside diphosphate kinase
MTVQDTGARPARLPSIRLTAHDHALLSGLIGNAPAEGAAALLHQELARASIHGSGRHLPTVGLNRWVHYVDGANSRTRRVKIVMPDQADIDQGLISPLSHVGAGLLGLSEGQSIAWPDPAGRIHKLTPVLIEDPDDLV